MRLNLSISLTFTVSNPAARAQMHKLRSLTGTSSSEGQGFQGVHGTESECRVDRFSNLPDGVAHHIVSFLTLKDLAHLGCLSKRCREIYLSNPSLNLELSKVETSTCVKWSRFLDCVDRFLNLRGDKKMHQFSITEPYNPVSRETPCVCGFEKCRIIPWIEKALRCEVEVMKLRFNLENVKTPYEFLSRFLHCGSLRALSMDLLYVTIKTPSISCLSNLESFTLKNVAIDEGLFKCISSSCKCIKELHLEHLRGVEDITIEIPSLKSFHISNFEIELRLKISGEKLEYIHVRWCSYSRHSWSLNIFAPNLKYLEWSGRIGNHQLGKLLYLEKANIHLWSSKDGDVVSGKIFDVLCSIHKVKVLYLQCSTIMALFEEGYMSVPPLLDVTYLRVDIGSLYDELVLALAFILRGMPNLSTLRINSSATHRDYKKIDCSGYDMEYWKSQDFPFISQLKEVTIEISGHSYGSNPIEFSRFILENAENLKKMVIVHQPRLAKSYLDKLNESKKTSNAEVVFHSKRYIT